MSRNNNNNNNDNVLPRAKRVHSRRLNKGNRVGRSIRTKVTYSGKYGVKTRENLM